MALTIFVVGAFLGIQSLKADSLPFGSTLTGMFPNIENNYASTNFIYGGNSFAGLIFWTTPTILSTPESISISWGTQSISCTTRINGIYYNNQRGRRIWPLDTWSLATLIVSGSSEYSVLNMNGGRYTNCTTVSWGFIPDSYAIFGQIDHTRSGTEFHLIAGLNYNATSTTNSISGIEFGNTLYAVGWLTGHMYDNYGGVAQVWGTGMGTLSFWTGLCSLFVIESSTLVAGNNMNFTCYANTTGTSITGYQLLIYDSTGINIYSNTVASTGGSNVQSAWSSLVQWNYTAECMVHGIPGWPNSCPTQAFTVTWITITTGSCGLWGDLSITTVPGLVVQTSNPSYYYIRTTWNIDFTIWANQPSYYAIVSSGITSTVTGFYNGYYNPPTYTRTNTGTLTISGNNGWQIINTTFTTWSCTRQAPAKWITIDTLPPSASTITSPWIGSGVCYVGAFDLSWTGAVDSWVGITSYNYKIYSDAGFASQIINASTTGTTVSLNANQLGTWYFSWTYYRSIEAIDGLNQTWTATTGYFNVGFDYCSTSGNVMIVGTIPRLRNADLNKEYLSDPFTVYNLPGPIIAYVSSWILYVNGTGTSNTGMIDNWDELNIQYTSSNEYDTTVSTVFYIANQHATFYITTRSTGYYEEPSGSGCNLNSAEKLIITDIFDMIKDSYDENETTLANFLFTMESMIEDELGFVDNCSLEYLLDLTSAYIMDNQWENIEEGEHEAPNCKLYDIEYSDSKEWYTSPDLKKRTYFASRDALTRYIDINNPWDCRINDYNDLPTRENNEGSGYYIATNGKMYDIQEKTENWTTIYYSPDFIRAKNFENKNDLYSYINKNNPIQDIRNHDVDTEFTPMIFAAPNGKEYKIYHTDRWYMSYKLMKIQYFETLDGIKNYITINNR